MIMIGSLSFMRCKAAYFYFKIQKTVQEDFGGKEHLQLPKSRIFQKNEKSGKYAMITTVSMKMRFE